MTVRRLLLGSFASGACVAIVLAQPGTSRSPVVGPLNILKQPRFVVILANIQAINETGIDALGSDDVFAVYETPLNSSATRIFRGLDSGDVQEVPHEQQFVWPAMDFGPSTDAQWTWVPGGGAAPVVFAIHLWRYDGPSFWPWGNTGFCGGTYRGHAPKPGPLTFCEMKFSTKLATWTFNFQQAELVAKMPLPGHGMTLDGPETTFVSHAALGGHEYRVRLLIRRDADHEERREVER